MNDNDVTRLLIEAESAIATLKSVGGRPAYVHEFENSKLIVHAINCLMSASGQYIDDITKAYDNYREPAAEEMTAPNKALDSTGFTTLNLRVVENAVQNEQADYRDFIKTAYQLVTAIQDLEWGDFCPNLGGDMFFGHTLVVGRLILLESEMEEIEDRENFMTECERVFLGNFEMMRQASRAYAHDLMAEFHDEAKNFIASDYHSPGTRLTKTMADSLNKAMTRETLAETVKEYKKRPPVPVSPAIRGLLH